jgi:hypothetical protein
MPAYQQSSASLPLQLLMPGDVGYAFGIRQVFANQTDAGEAVTTNEASQAFALMTGGMPYAGSPQQISMELVFNQAPGAFNFQLQTADTDNPAAYQTEPNIGTVTATGSSSATSVRVEAQIKARFARIFVSLQPANGGTTVIAKLCR